MSEHETSTEPLDESTTPSSASPTPRPRRRRAGRKRVTFRRFPQPAPSVRGSWLIASEAERSQAHRLCMAILEYWMGRASKEQIAERLGLPPLRVWQLSQQALSGMLVGLLRLPRSREKLAASSALPANDTSTLKQRIAELEKKLARTEDLVRVLKHLPWQQTEGGNGRPPTGPAKEKGRRRRKRAPAPRSQAAASDRTPAGPQATQRRAEEG